ncbi:hypothetical protein [Acinetobacter piscicola]|uniref:hypothetical protein n=1 Tax=Acinetobacter piscicola TaxID=2006115 RepID=UPI000B7CAA34|nr:hypothetical protein [Acinetobacter piscicola]
MLLDFWYSERCTRQIKLMVSVITCAIIYYCSTFEKLSPIFTLASLAIGISIHVLRNISIKIAMGTPYLKLYKILFAVFPIFTFSILVFLLPNANKLYTAIQALGFVALGLFVVSIYESRQKRFE